MPKPAKNKRSLQIADESGLQIQVTLWGNNATKLEFTEGKVFAIKGAKVSDYQGKSLNAGDDTQIFLNPENKRTEELTRWYMTKPEALNSITQNNLNREGSNNPDQPRVAENFKLIQELIEAVNADLNESSNPWNSSGKPQKAKFYKISGFI